MGSANYKALAFAAMLMLALPGFCDARTASPPSSDPAPATEMSDYQNDPERSSEADPEESSLFAQPWFSTLGALALGLLGLLWMRRRAADM